MLDNFIVFWQNPTKAVNGKYQIEARINVNETLAFMPLDIFLYPKDWDLIGCISHIASVNKRLEEIKKIFLAVHKEFVGYGAMFYAEDVKREILNYGNRKIAPSDEMIAEMHAAMFSSKRPPQPLPTKKQSSKKQIELDIKLKMAKRKLNVLLDA